MSILPSRTSYADITTAREAIERIAATIVERGIPGLMPDMGIPETFKPIAGSVYPTCLRAEWKTCGGKPEDVDASIVVVPIHHAAGRITLDVFVRLPGGLQVPRFAAARLKLHTAVVALAEETYAVWDGKVLATR